MLNVDDIESSALNVLIYIKEGRNDILKRRIKIHSSRLSTQVRVARRRRPRRSSEVSLPGSVISDYQRSTLCKFSSKLQRCCSNGPHKFRWTRMISTFLSLSISLCLCCGIRGWSFDDTVNIYYRDVSVHGRYSLTYALLTWISAATTARRYTRLHAHARVQRRGHPYCDNERFNALVPSDRAGYLPPFPYVYQVQSTAGGIQYSKGIGPTVLPTAISNPLCTLFRYSTLTRSLDTQCSAFVVVGHTKTDSARINR